MTGRVAGKVAFVTGAARGQGRSHAVRLAQEGADIIAVDICQPFAESPAPPATPEDLAETADLVKDLDRRIVTAEADVRDYDALKAAVDSGVEQLGGLDIIVANAGIGTGGVRLDRMNEDLWQEMIDVNLSGVWKSVKAGVPHLISGGRGGSIILTSSVAGLKTYPHTGHYVAAKHGVVGLMRSFAVELGRAVDPRQLRAPDAREHAVVDQRDNVPAVPARPGEPRPRRSRPGLSDVPHAADPVGDTRRHQQRGAVPGVRRSPIHHRRRPSGRRGQLPEVTPPTERTTAP